MKFLRRKLFCCTYWVPIHHYATHPRANVFFLLFHTDVNCAFQRQTAASYKNSSSPPCHETRWVKYIVPMWLSMHYYVNLSCIKIVFSPFLKLTIKSFLHIVCGHITFEREQYKALWKDFSKELLTVPSYATKLQTCSKWNWQQRVCSARLSYFPDTPTQIFHVMKYVRSISETPTHAIWPSIYHSCVWKYDDGLQKDVPTDLLTDASYKTKVGKSICNSCVWRHGCWWSW